MNNKARRNSETIKSALNCKIQHQLPNRNAFTKLKK